jgi:hypothetical protein
LCCACARVRVPRFTKRLSIVRRYECARARKRWNWDALECLTEFSLVTNGSVANTKAVLIRKFKNHIQWFNHVNSKS